jgi:hypothetical protein
VTSSQGGPNGTGTPFQPSSTFRMAVAMATTFSTTASAVTRCVPREVDTADSGHHRGPR